MKTIYSFLILMMIEFTKEEENKNSTIKNMCGKVGDYIEPLNENDCQKGKKKFGGKCCFMKLERLETIYNEDTNNNEEVLTKHSACIEVPSFSNNDFKLANIVAYNNGYNVEIKCNNNFFQINILLLLFTIIFLI